MGEVRLHKVHIFQTFKGYHTRNWSHPFSNVVSVSDNWTFVRIEKGRGAHEGGARTLCVEAVCESSERKKCAYIKALLFQLLN